MEDGTSGVCECLLSYFCILLMEQENPFCYGDVCRCHFLNKRPAKRIFRLNCLEMCYDVITSGWRCVQNPELCFQLSYMIVSFILVWTELNWTADQLTDWLVAVGHSECFCQQKASVYINPEQLLIGELTDWLIWLTGLTLTDWLTDWLRNQRLFWGMCYTSLVVVLDAASNTPCSNGPNNLTRYKRPQRWRKRQDRDSKREKISMDTLTQCIQ